MKTHTDQKRLIDKYIDRIKTSFPEDDKLMIDLQDFANELSINLNQTEPEPLSAISVTGQTECNEFGNTYSETCADLKF